MRFTKARWPFVKALPVRLGPATVFLLCLSLSLSIAAAGTAQPPSQRSEHPSEDVIVLGEVLPVLEGTELGAIVVGPAPPPGTARQVRRSEVIAALRRAGRSRDGLAIPRAVLIRRQVQTLEGEALLDQVRRPIEQRLSPCEVVDLRVSGQVRLPPGDIDMEIDVRRPTRASSSAGGTVLFSVRGTTRRLPFRAQLRCPPPAVSPGASVSIVVQFGVVRASAPGEASQAGRIGDVIRVRNLATRASLLARVVNASTVEVVQ